MDKFSTVSWRQGQEGSLLIEVLISILIFSFAILGLVAMQGRAVQFSVEGEDRNRAALLANEMVSTMWARKSSNKRDLADEIIGWQAKVRAALPPYDNNVTAEVSDPDGDGVVTIRLTWMPVAGHVTGNGASVPHSYMTQVVIQ